MAHTKKLQTVVKEDGTVIHDGRAIGTVGQPDAGIWASFHGNGDPTTAEFTTRRQAVAHLVYLDGLGESYAPKSFIDRFGRCSGHCTTAEMAGIDDPETLPADTIIKAYPGCPEHGTRGAHD